MNAMKTFLTFFCVNTFVCDDESTERVKNTNSSFNAIYLLHDQAVKLIINLFFRTK